MESSSSTLPTDVRARGVRVGTTAEGVSTVKLLRLSPTEAQFSNFVSRFDALDVIEIHIPNQLAVPVHIMEHWVNQLPDSLRVVFSLSCVGPDIGRTFPDPALVARLQRVILATPERSGPLIIELSGWQVASARALERWLAKLPQPDTITFNLVDSAWQQETVHELLGNAGCPWTHGPSDDPVDYDALASVLYVKAPDTKGDANRWLSKWVREVRTRAQRNSNAIDAGGKSRLVTPNDQNARKANQGNSKTGHSTNEQSATHGMNTSPGNIDGAVTRKKNAQGAGQSDDLFVIVNSSGLALELRWARRLKHRIAEGLI